MKQSTYSVVYTWQDGRKEVRYRRPRTDTSLAREVMELKRSARQCNHGCCYSVDSKNNL